ncbi:restriction endonuclease subunit S [Peptoniphilus vaginalis]|uniref:restriction endonuclease subunit S n=1 Tax=Peptoniphilus vaginalis TaxID=1756987 RepID=UPI000A26E050|nr:restriction endonuclease subunit S [Peptoniphilus vaginalis]
MSKIDELLKNEKVEWKKLGEVCEIKTGQAISKTKIEKNKGIYPVINSGKDPLGYINIWNTEDDPIGITSRGAGVGSITYQLGKYYRGNLNYSVTIKGKEILRVRFLYHLLNNLQTDIHKLCSFNGIPALNASELKTLKIPIPSLEIQEKIVKTLDKFTNYVTELQAELQARNKQYEYYRDTLLSEKYLTKLTNEFCQIEDLKSFDFVKISELCLRQRGIKITAEQMKSLDKENSSVKVFAGGNTTANLSTEEVGIENIINKPSVIVKSRGNIDFEYYDRDFTHKNEMWSYSSLDEEKLNIKFLYYILKNNLKYFKDNAISGKLPQIATGLTDNYKVPLPSIHVQNKVVEVLDKFQELLSDSQGLLPEEIEERQKQYEYYREKLLTFEDKSDSTPHAARRTPHAARRKITLRSYFATLKQACDIVGIRFIYNVSDFLLKDITNYSNEKINVNDLNNSNYVGVDNLLKDKCGKVDSSYLPPEGKVNIFRENDVLLGNIRPYLRKIWLSDRFGGANGDVLIFVIKDDWKNNILPKYLYQVLSSEKFFDYNINFSKGAKMPRGDKKKIMEYKILVPPMEVQEKVVSILDKFDRLVNDIKEGLPKEIELRQKQYEYYRERLLNFPK